MTYEEIHWRSWGPIGVRSQHFFRLLGMWIHSAWNTAFCHLSRSSEQCLNGLHVSASLFSITGHSHCFIQNIHVGTCMPDNMSKTGCLTVLEVKQNRETITKGSHNEESTRLYEWRPGFWKEETWRCETKGLEQI